MNLRIISPFLKFLTGGHVLAITLFPFGIYFKNDYYLNDPETANHEKIHWKQQLGMFIIGIIISIITGVIFLLSGISSWLFITLIIFPFLFFYLWYVIEWFIKIFFYSKRAYMNISFERESYANDNNLNYHKTQKWYSWMKYIFNL